MDKDRFISYFERKVKDTIKEYSLIDKKDKIAVACSGGKDSTTILYILNKIGYKTEAITVDALIGNYTKKNKENIIQFCKDNKIPLHIISFRDEFGHSLCYLRSVLNSKGVKLKSCTICGVLRRHLLNKHVKKLRFTKIVTGHNKDDEAQAIMMNLFKNELEILARIGPSTTKLKSSELVPRIKPLYNCTEKEVERYSKLMDFPVKYGECPCRTDSFRNFTRQALDDLNDKTKDNIIKNFLKILPNLRKEYSKSKELNSCRYCKEPAKEDTCQACKIIRKLR